jgi:hypothetical protein
MRTNSTSRLLPALRRVGGLAGVFTALALLRPTATTGQSLFKTNGNASTSASCSASGFTLTPNMGNQSGSVWRTQQLTLAKSFALQFSVYLGTNDGSGGDGMTFALQRSANGTSALGGGGQNMGMAAISPSIVVEFDTYDNGTGIGDIAADHLSILKNGQFGAPVTFTTPDGGTAKAIAAVVNASGTAQNIENNTYYPVKISWNVTTKTLQVYFNEVLRATYSEDFVNTVFGNNPLAYWGFTASTGGAFNKQEVCNPTLDYDQDSDGLTDRQDADDDNDGIADVGESGNADATGDADADGILNYQDADFGQLNATGVVSTLDADGDGLINQFDLDADSDGLPDVVEGTSGQMSAGFRSLYSAALGQYTTSTDASGRPQSTASYTTIPDTDQDGVPDYLDRNSDNDAFADWVEAFDDNSNGRSQEDFLARAAAFSKAGGSSSFYPITPVDSNGTPEWLKDSNSNGVPNFLDLTSTFYHDTDGDGLVDLLDPSNAGQAYADVSGLPDKNANGLPDYRDAAVAIPLPVELISFTVRTMSGRAYLTWVTASERNSAYFAVEVSLNGRDFSSLDHVAAAGTTTQQHTYAYTDVASYVGALRYYRLRQVDQAGEVHYSAPQAVTTAAVSPPTAWAQPNPSSSDLVTLYFPSTQAGAAILQVFTAAGQQKLQQSVVLQAGTTQLLLPEARNWSSGLYVVRLQQGTQQYVLRIVRE